MKIKGVVEDLKIKKSFLIKKIIIAKIYLEISLVLLWTVWGQFIFRQFLDPAYTSQDLQAPSHVVSANYRVLIYCTCHFQGGSLCFNFFCLLVSPVSNFHPDTRGRWWSLFKAHLFSPAVGREEHCKPIALACAHSVLASLGLPPLTVRGPSLPTLLRLQVAPLGTVRGQPWAACTFQV